MINLHSSAFKKLTQKFGWNFIGNLSMAFSNWFILAMIAKFDGEQSVGVYSFGLAVISPVFMFADLQHRVIASTDVNKVYSLDLFKKYKYFGWIFSFIFLISFLLIKSFSSFEVFVFLLIFFNKIHKSISDLYYGFLQQNNRIDLVGKSLVLKSFVLILSFYFSYFYLSNLLIALTIGNIGLVIIFYLTDVSFLRKFKNHINTSFASIKFNKKFLMDSLALGLAMLLISLRSNIPKYFIENLLDYEALGIFSAIVYFLVAGGLFANSLGQTMITSLAKQFNNNQIATLEKNILRLVGVGIILGIIGLLVSVFFGEMLLKIAYTENISTYNELFILIMISGIFSFPASFLGYTISAFKMFKLQFPLYLLLNLFIFIFSYICIPIFHLKGAAIALIAGNFLNFIILSFIVYKKIRFIRNSLKLKI